MRTFDFEFKKYFPKLIFMLTLNILIVSIILIVIFVAPWERDFGYYLFRFAIFIYIFNIYYYFKGLLFRVEISEDTMKVHTFIKALNFNKVKEIKWKESSISKIAHMKIYHNKGAKSFWFPVGTSEFNGTYLEMKEYIDSTINKKD